MTRWLSSSKVRLGLVINGLYLLSLLVPSPRSTAVLYARTYERPPARLRAVEPPEYAPLPQQTQPLKAEAHYWKQTDQLDVYLTRELLLVRERGHTLLLSPTFTTRALVPERPRNVLMYFSAFSHEQFYDRNSSFVITADGEELWRYGWRAPGDETPWNMKALHSAALDGSGQVVETLGHEIPYDLFVRIVGARRVAIELGPERIELTPEQLGAMRDMHSRLLQQTRPTNPHGAGQKMNGVYLYPGTAEPNH
jgi:hypothetical protein